MASLSCTKKCAEEFEALKNKTNEVLDRKTRTQPFTTLIMSEQKALNACYHEKCNKDMVKTMKSTLEFLKDTCMNDKSALKNRALCKNFLAKLEKIVALKSPSLNDYERYLHVVKDFGSKYKYV